MTNACRAGIVTALLAATPAATAHAATLDYAVGDGTGGEPSLRYTAATGERNRLTITPRAESATIVDPGALIQLENENSSGCEVSRNRHRATCPDDDFIVFIVDLGDRSDTLHVTGPTAGRPGYTRRTEARRTKRLVERYVNTEEAFLFRLRVDGGAGNDRIFGTKFTDFVNPGAGRDLVDTAGGDDRITIAPDGVKDRLFAGRGIDTVDALAQDPLTIDLVKQTFVFGPGETDALNSAERAHGGSGNDVLKGTRFADGLAGDGGDDSVRGGAGNDYVAGDLPPQDAREDTPGVDELNGGMGDDIVDGRDFDTSVSYTQTPTDQLACGAGRDLVLARQDDFVDRCETSAWGDFGGYIYGARRALAPKSLIEPVARGADGAPTYAIACADHFDACHGRVQLERPPVAGATGEPELFGSGEFTIEHGKVENVAVTLNDAGRAALAVPGAHVSVHVLVDPGQYEPRPRADFGWQQVLGQ